MSLGATLRVLWCRWMHGGGSLRADPFGRLNWQCAKCGRWAKPLPIRYRR